MMYSQEDGFGELDADRQANQGQPKIPSLRVLTAEEVEEIRARHGVQALQAYEAGQGDYHAG